jgi:hypothetical protein
MEVKFTAETQKQNTIQCDISRNGGDVLKR